MSTNNPLKGLFFFFFLIAISNGAAIAQIGGPGRVSVRQGGTHQFAGTCPQGHACEFRMYPGHDATSSVSADGLYTAPASATRHGSVGGCPVQPHNSIYNVRVDKSISGLPPMANSDAQISLMMSTSNGSASKGLWISSSNGLGTNVVSNATPTMGLKGYFNTLWDGDYRIETPATVAGGSRTDPLATLQTGWLTTANGGADHHYMSVNKDDCEFQEIYFGSITPVGGTFTSQSRSRTVNSVTPGHYNAADFLNSDGLAGVGATTSIAAGMWLTPMQLSAVEAVRVADAVGADGDLGHALALTLPNSAIAPQSAVGGPGQIGHVWPATANSWVGYGNILYGTRFRLKPEFVAAYNPAVDSANPRVQAILMVLLHTVERYGMFLMDGTSAWSSFELHARSQRFQDPEFNAAMNILAGSANLASNWTNPSTWNPAKSLIANLEAVDESSLRALPTSNVVLAAHAKPERVIWRDVTAGTDLDFRDIAIVPPTIGASLGQVTVVSGAAVDLSQFVWSTGFEHNTFGWSVASGGGNVTGSGTYSAPIVATPAIEKVRATATDDPAQYAEIRVVVLPPIGSKLCVRLANVANAATGGCTFWGRDGSGTPLMVGGRLSTQWMQTGAAPDAAYSSTAYQGSAWEEQSLAIYLPNGRYKVSTLMASPYAGGNKTQIELQNQISLPPTDVYAQAGAPAKGMRYEGIAVVSDGRLTWANRRVGSAAETTYPYISSLVIEPDTSSSPVPLFTISPSSVVGGQSATAYVTLGSAAPTGGAVVALASSSAAATVPASVAVAAGATSATFTISTKAVAAATSATISATYLGTVRTTALTVAPAALKALTISTAVTGSTSAANNTVAMTGPVAAATTVSLSSSNPSVAAVPSSVTIPAGASSATFTITCASVATSTAVGITATYGGVTKSANISVQSGSSALSSVLLSSTTAVGGAATSANKVVLTALAVADTAVALSSSNAAVAATPAQVIVPAGANSAAFTITTSGVSAQTPVTIKASLGATTKSQTLTVNPASLSALSISPGSITGGLAARNNSILLDASAGPAGAAVSLSSANPALAAVPSAVTVPAGGKQSPYFQITTSNVSATTTVAISATYGAATKTATLTINPLALYSMTLSPNPSVGGANTLYNAVTLNAPAGPNGAVVTLTSANAALAAVPASVFVAAGATTSPNFSITTAKVTAATTVPITASYGGVSKTATLTLNPVSAALSSLSLSPVSVSGGAATLFNSAALSGPAGANGAVVTLASSNPAVAAAPSTITISAGVTSEYFAIVTNKVSASTTVAITATYGGVSKTVNLNVNP